MKPGYPNGCRGAVMCRTCWLTYREWFEWGRYQAQRILMPDVCPECEEREMAARFRDAANKEVA